MALIQFSDCQRRRNDHFHDVGCSFPGYYFAQTQTANDRVVGSDYRPPYFVRLAQFACRVLVHTS